MDSGIVCQFSDGWHYLPALPSTLDYGPYATREKAERVQVDYEAYAVTAAKCNHG